MTDDTTWFTARLAATEAQIIAYEEALTAIAGGAQSYSLDTGQTRQTVTKANLTEIRNALSSLENRRATLKARLCGGSVYGRPEF
jgi:hypothetical protein